MSHKKVGLGVAVLVLSAVLGATVLREPIAFAATPFQNVIITNTASQPVPVSIGNTAGQPVPVKSPPQPLWQGTPYVSTQIILDNDTSNCDTFAAIPAGKILYVERVITDFNLKPGAGAHTALRITPLGGSSNTLDIPAYPTAPASQVAGLYDDYTGSLDVGLPTSAAPQACIFGDRDDDYAAGITVTGYLVDAP